MIETSIRNPEKHETVRADGQGRVSLGVEYADHDVEIVVVDAEPSESEGQALQQAIGDRPMTDAERKGMLFVRSFGIDRTCLDEHHDADVGEDGVDATSVGLSDVDWHDDVLVDDENVARFQFDGDDDPAPYCDEPTAEPVAVEVVDDDAYGVPVYRYENERGDASALSREYVEKVQRIYGYDPTADLSHVRVHPDEGPFPVIFHDPAGETHITIAPRVAD